jgi:hypothetical protein
MIEALKWVNSHIHKFGGDKSKVTVMAESFGSMATGHLTRAKPAQGLFRSVIPISGFLNGARSIDPSDPSASDGVSELQQVLDADGQSIFNMSTDAVLNLVISHSAEFVASNSRLNMAGPMTSSEIFMPQNLQPAWDAFDLGRDDDHDVPMLLLNNDQEYRGGPLFTSFPPDQNMTDANLRAWIDSQMQSFPLYLRCLLTRVEKLELEGGASPMVALFRAFQHANAGNGAAVPVLSNRPNVFTATSVDMGARTCDDDIRSVFNLVTPHHSSVLLGLVCDLPPWSSFLSGTPEELKNTTIYQQGAIAPCETLHSMQHALEIGFVNRTVHHMMRKAIIDFVNHGNPGWGNDQHASFQPTLDGKPILTPAFNDIVNATQTFTTKCWAVCPDAVPPSAGTIVSEDICAPILENVECAC